MKYKGCLLISRSYGTSSYFVLLPGKLRAEIFANRGYCTSHQSQKDEPSKTVYAKRRAVAALQKCTEVGQLWGQNLARTASTTANYWWVKYEEFVGLNEVRDAQTKVTEVSQPVFIFLPCHLQFMTVLHSGYFFQYELFGRNWKLKLGPEPFKGNQTKYW